MKILNQDIGSVYIWAIALLTLLACLSSYALRSFPLPLIVSVAAAALAETTLSGLVRRQRTQIPFSGIITGLIIGSVAPINAPLLVVIAASLIAVLSKFFIKAKHSNVFNPAAFGLLIALSFFGIGDEWWAATSYNLHGFVLSATPLLAIAAYKARRLAASLSFAAVSIAIYLVSSHSGISSVSIDTLLFSVNYYFAFVMLADPKTSPHGRAMQVIYGVSVAMLYAMLAVYAAPYPAFIALLTGNLLYALYRILKRHAQ
ncbi:MAG: RnfABCDGE type electron transport complex subunit D [Candidatus Micrarchaeota archaeon]|nr:RnfABCDGE type electron transport complex subunit D [Candidatus Micrarchaeota archaeon]MDE1823855.1 RnfABCDGE type electron transport complex subunit D [Candidatus Micrarchaeota archaeon]MDE1849455.1 RnfABCDGE type electron transport complex subunit D [Candidatus Micrarchaeota archaeon]